MKKAMQMGAAVVVVLFSAAVARAVTNNPQCVHEANQVKKDCVAKCQDNFEDSKDLCRNVDHDCAEACRAGRAACVAPIKDALAACLDDCQGPLDAAKADCRAKYASGTAERDSCIDAAQLTAFQCRDECRETANSPDNRKTLRACRKGFHGCVAACPSPAPAATPTP